MQVEFYRDFQFTLAAGEMQTIFAWGRFFTMLANSSATDLLVSINGQAAQPVPNGVGLELPLEESPYSTITITNPSGAPMTVRFAISNGRVIDNRNVTSGLILVSDTAEQANTRSLNGNTGTQVIASLAPTNNTTATIYTVTGGKTLFLTSYDFALSDTGNGVETRLVVTNAADVEQYRLASVVGSTVPAIQRACAVLTYPIKIVATWKIKAVASVSGYAAGRITGWEE